ncbi:MAG: hypothetical protein K6U74_19055, partial [Firmicutes bacterium]|nr:hypothetical protein [Bacillota bacterium]
MNLCVRERLKQLLVQYGPDLCADRQQLEKLLRDSCGQHSREISALVAAVKEGVTEELLKVSDSQAIDAWL